MIFQECTGVLRYFLYPNKEAPEVEVNNAAKICGQCRAVLGQPPLTVLHRHLGKRDDNSKNNNATLLTCECS